MHLDASVGPALTTCPAWRHHDDLSRAELNQGRPSVISLYYAKRGVGFTQVRHLRWIQGVEATLRGESPKEKQKAWHVLWDRYLLLFRERTQNSQAFSLLCLMPRTQNLSGTPRWQKKKNRNVKLKQSKAKLFIHLFSFHFFCCEVVRLFISILVWLF